MSKNPEAELDIFTDEERETLKQRINVGERGKDDERIFVPRGRMVKQNLDKIFNKDISCVRDKGGDVIYPNDWVLDCLPHPALYYIVEATKIEPRIDPEEDLYYSGTSILLIENVPEMINKISLECWLRFGLGECDPPLQRCLAEIEKLEMGIVAVERKLQKVPYLTFQGETEKGQMKERQRIGGLLNEERSNYEVNLDMEKDKLVSLKKRPKTKIDLIRLDTNKQTKMCTWHMVFPGEERAHELSTALAMKEDWGEISLVMEGYRGERPWAGRGEIPPESDPSLYVNTRLVEVVREMHGPKACTFYFPNGDLFHGGFKYGKMDGYGELYMKTGRYEGEMKNDKLHGEAYYVLSNGTQYDGGFDKPNAHALSLIDGDEYGGGVMHGKGKMNFPDGAVYDGHWRNGKACGPGKYTSKEGNVKEGTFEDGMLEGKNGSDSYVEGASFMGNFHHGRLQGYGESEFVGGHKHRGYYVDGKMEGFGVYDYDNNDHYEGYYKDNLRHGHGMLSEGNVKQVFEKGVEYWRYDHRYSGVFKFNKIRGRNTIIIPIRLSNKSDDVSNTVLSYTTSNKSPGYPRLMELPKLELRADRRFRKRQERRHNEHKKIVEKLEGLNFRNFMRARFRSRVLIEESADFVDRVKTQIAADKAREKARRHREAVARALQERQFGGGNGKVEVVEEEEDDEIINQLQEMIKKLEMVEIMRHPPNKTYLEETLDEMEIQEENFLQQSKNKLASKKRRRKGKVSDDQDASQFKN
jgi:hypothetical protein